MTNEKCRHESWEFSCDKPRGHKGLHEQRARLRDGRIERTNWGDDGLAVWATKDTKRLRESKVIS